jgi:O-glycosyl hydrolase
MKKTAANIEHRIQLKRDEITRYVQYFQNYPADRMERSGIPYLTKLQNELIELQNEN